jgi:DNA-binding SARP family transcriptional activator
VAGRMQLLTDVFELFPYGIAVTSRTGAIITWNRALEEIVGRSAELEGRACCDLFGCRRPGGRLEGICLTQAVLDAGQRLPELLVRTPQGGEELWVTAAPLYPDTSCVVFQVRIPDGADERTPSPEAPVPRLRIYTLGRTSLEARGRPVAGEWLEQRPGQLLKFLVCERHRVVATEELAEAVWPNPRSATPGTVRYFVHELREKLEPERPRHGRSALVLARRGGYTLNTRQIWVDADEFEAGVGGGLAAFAQGEAGTAADRLGRAVSLYRDDFLADEPYAEWALGERERLRTLVERALQVLRELQGDDLDAAAGYLERLAEMEPLDQEIQRQLLALWMKQGRRSRAARHYRAFQLRVLRAFGEEPDFSLADLAANRS